MMQLEQAHTRDDIINVLEGFGDEPVTTPEGVVRNRRPLVKSYLLETVPPHRHEPSLTEAFKRISCRMDPVDNRMFKVFDTEKLETIGVVETLMDRHPVYYTTEASHKSDRLVRKLVESNPDLDHLWISGGVFDQLFKIVCDLTPPHRFGRLVFQHTSLFELEDEHQAPGAEDDSDDGAIDEDLPEPNDDEYFVERRATKFSMIERLGELKAKLPDMRKLHKPLYSISQIRFPASGRGGHDFFHDGKVTNRSRSFAEHRQKIEYVLKLYKRLTEQTEQSAWQNIERTTIKTAGQMNVLAGAPVVLVFSSPLSQSVFDQFIRATFRYENNRFRLWGNPIRLGPTKVHVYGVDRHIWQQIFLEITDKQIVAIVPHGTCGNSIHRLVTNVQQYLDPAVQVSVGDRAYNELILENLTEGGGPRDAKANKRLTR